MRIWLAGLRVGRGRISMGPKGAENARVGAGRRRRALLAGGLGAQRGLAASGLKVEKSISALGQGSLVLQCAEPFHSQ